MEYLGLTLALAAIAQIGSNYFWLLLLRRDKALPEAESGVPLALVAGLCFVLMVAEGLAVLAVGVFQPGLHVVLLGLTIQPVEIIALWALFARPRLCWPRCLCLLAAHPAAFWLARELTRAEGADDWGAAAAVIFKTIALAPVLGSVAAWLAAEWVLIRAAERKGTGPGGAWPTT